MFKQFIWKGEYFKDKVFDDACFDPGNEFWNTQFQLATLPIVEFAAMTIGCNDFLIDCLEEPSDPSEYGFSFSGKNAVLREFNRRRRVLENNAEAGKFKAELRGKIWYCDLKEAINWVINQGWELPAPMRNSFGALQRTTCLETKVQNSKELPDERRVRLQKRVDEERAKGNRAFNKTVAAEEGIDVSRLKQILGRKSKITRPHEWLGLTTSSSQSTSKKSKNKY